MPKSTRPTDRRVLLVWLAVAAVAVVALVGPWGAKMIDLDVYRAGARALLDGRDPYSVTDPATGLPFTYPVFAALLFVPFAIMPLLVARTVITVLSVAALVVICWLTLAHRRPWGAASTSPREGRAPSWRATAGFAAVAALAHPVLDTLLFGQINLILVAMVLVDVFVLPARWRGVLIGVAAGVKLTPGLFVAYYLVIGEWRAARTAALTAVGTVLIGLVVQPSAAWAFFSQHMLNPARTGNVTYAGNQSVLATTARLTRDALPPSVLTLSLSVVVVVVALLLARKLERSGQRLAAVCAVAVATLLASPISWTHHWVWAVPALGVAATWASRLRWPAWVGFGLAAAVVVSGPMRFMPKNDLRELRQTLPEQLVTNSYALLAVGFLVCAAFAVRAARWPEHLRGRNLRKRNLAFSERNPTGGSP